MNTKDLERAAVAMVRGGLQFIVGSGIIIAHELTICGEQNTSKPVELRTLHAVRKFLEVRS
jgi:hypothetical protein